MNPTVRPRRLRDLLRTGVGGLVAAVQCVAFWCAVVLPLISVPTALGGVQASPPTVAALLGANALALVVGHRHNYPDAASETE